MLALSLIRIMCSTTRTNQRLLTERSLTYVAIVASVTSTKMISLSMSVLTLERSLSPADTATTSQSVLPKLEFMSVPTTVILLMYQKETFDCRVQKPPSKTSSNLVKDSIQKENQLLISLTPAKNASSNLPTNVVLSLTNVLIFEVTRIVCLLPHILSHFGSFISLVFLI